LGCIQLHERELVFGSKDSRITKTHLLEDMTMKEQLAKWLLVLALISFVAAVLLVDDGHYWPGIAFIVVGGGLSSAAAVYKKKK